jgi:hypothetical protein
MRHPSLWELLWGTWRGGSFVRGPEGYERKALRMGISPHGGSVGQPGVGSFARDFEIWLKGALGVESLWQLCEGNLEGGLPCWGPLGIGRKGSGDGHLSQQRPHLGNLEEGSSTGDFER